MKKDKNVSNATTNKGKETKNNRLLNDFIPIVTGIARMFGENCEVILHDVSDLQHSVIAVENSHITGRKVGSSMSTSGLYFLKSELFQDVDYIANYRTVTSDGKNVKSTTIFLRDQHKKIIGFLCINFAIDDFLEAREKIDRFCFIKDPSEVGIEEAEKEDFVNTPDELFTKIFQQAVSSMNKNIDDMNRDDKVLVVKYLNDRGIFLVKGAIDKTAQMLNVSKYTIYNYLLEIKPLSDNDEASLLSN